MDLGVDVADGLGHAPMGPALTTGAAAVRRARQDPDWFFEHVLGVEHYYDKQREINRAVRDHPRVAVLGANGTGKDWNAGRIMLWWQATHYPAKTVVLGPTHRQVSDIVFKEARSGYLTRRYAPGLGGRFFLTSRWEVNDNHYAVGFATNDDYNIQGFHSPNLLVIITEAHNMPQGQIDAVKRLFPSCILMTGNPFCSAGEFYEAFNANAEAWHTVHISAFDTPNIQQGTDLIPGMVTMENIQRLKEDWGEESAMYIATVLGEFADDLDDTIVPRSQIMAAVKRELPPEPGDSITLSCDVARHGSDRTVVYRRQGKQYRKIWDVQGHDTMAVAGRLILLAEEEPEDVSVEIIVDESGVGGGVLDRLNEESDKIRGGDCAIIGFNGGSTADNEDRYVNAIAEAWLELARAIKDGQVDLDDNPAMISQLSSRRYKVQGDRRLRLEPKDEYKARIKRSPDDADALAQLFSPLCGSPGFRFFDV
tara:strand:- start:2777 stop:4216 length:1440 start_codon:yes stop_codon:yes gene_type:complete